MTSLISAISGQFSKALVLGTFLPATVFTILGIVVVGPLSPDDWPQLRSLRLTDTQWVLGVSFFVILLTGLLYNLNIPLIQLYEGYQWKESWLGQWKVRRYSAKLRAARARWAGMRPLADALHKCSQYDDQSLAKYQSTITELRIDAGTSLNDRFPDGETLVLPTRLGNVIRSFESYPDRQYKIAGITVWTRLIAKIDKDYAVALDDAKTSFDFTLNCSALSGALALAVLIVGLLYPSVFISPLLWAPWLAKVFGFATMSYVFYTWSIGRASNWGTMVKAAFDLYRWDMLKQLGFTTLPVKLTEERELWDDISNQFIYGDSPRVRLAEYVPQTIFARGEPYYIDLEITRGIQHVEGGGIQIKVRVKNNDSKKREVQDVVVTDIAPAGYEYDWGSFECDRKGVVMLGTNPYKFVVGCLQPGDEVVLSYRALSYQETAAGGAPVMLKQ